ncbi:MAG: hypothetical protein WC449_05725 [Candidatus Paceibacterota bacterium]
MSNNPEMYQRDAQWLDDYCIKHNLDAPTDAQVDAFCEKVAMMCSDAGMSDKDARIMAFKEVFSD